MERLHGVITALMTVADENGNMDMEATVAYARHCVGGGVDGLFVSGTNGEGIRFSVEERLDLAKRMVKEFKGKADVCIHTGAARLEDTIALTRGAWEAGADCAAIVTPAFICYSDEELYDYFCAVSASVPADFPLYMYNIPPRTGNDLKPEVAARIFRDCPNVVGMKASFCDLPRSLEYLSVEGMALLQGSDVYQLEFLAMGCDGVISGLSGVYPVPFVQVRDAWRRGDLDAARAWQKICGQVCKVACGGNVNVMQSLMHLKGYRSTQNKICGDLEALRGEMEALDALIAEKLA